VRAQRAYACSGPCAQALRARQQRARGRPHAERLRALDPAVFDSLPERDRNVVTRYYGVAGQREHTLAELGTSPTRLLRSIRRSVASVLGSAEVSTEARDS
jgi:DNA-directed RNA polymerase specialized sigma subunit